MESCQGDELELVAKSSQLFAEGEHLVLVQFSRPIERWRAIVCEQLARVTGVNSLCEFFRLAEVGMRRLTPHQVCVRRVGETTADRLLQSVLHAIESFVGSSA